MNEKIYKTMSSTGACSLAVGIIVLTTGIVTGIMMIVSGARLLKKKSDILIKDRINHMGKFFELSVSDREIALCGFSVRNRRKH